MLTLYFKKCSLPVLEVAEKPIWLASKSPDLPVSSYPLLGLQTHTSAPRGLGVHVCVQENNLSTELSSSLKCKRYQLYHLFNLLKYIKSFICAQVKSRGTGHLTTRTHPHLLFQFFQSNLLILAGSLIKGQTVGAKEEEFQFYAACLNYRNLSKVQPKRVT